VRLSAQPVFAEIVGKLNEPLAVPSANRFGRVSPTTAHHVLDELDGRIRLIVDAGATEHGIESTIVSFQEGKIAILRRGPITDEQLAEFADIVTVHVTQRISAPGQLPSHYRPATPLCLIDRAEDYLKPKDQRVGLLAWKSSGSSAADTERFAAFRILSQRGDLREAAANLFRYLRELDVLGLDLIVAERVPSQGLGAAIMDRLQRASHR
jgi:L-threonylcarbamoyladenylate synthase